MVLLGVPMLLLLALVARFQLVSLKLPSMVGALATLFASTCPATALTARKGVTKPIMSSRQRIICQCWKRLKIRVIVISPYFIVE